jgi:Na+/proline symporter
MTPISIIVLIAIYFLVLIAIARVTGKSANNNDFFLAGRQAPWMLVAFGMIGASLSGITFISIPGKAGITNGSGQLVDQFSYMQMVLGYLVGYVFIALVLLPVYYKLNLTSIYGFLHQRFGKSAWKTGAFFFILSRTLGSAIRLLLVANVLQTFVFEQWGVPFIATVALSIALIWVYTQRGGMKTIIYTDTLQTLFMLLSLGLSIFLIADSLNLSGSETWQAATDSKFSQWFFFNDFASNDYHFIKQFIAGFFICIGMTGMDQDMMQKNLSCKNLRDAQKNMLSFAVVLTLVNFVFMALGALLFMYAENAGISLPLSAAGRPRTDLLFPIVALQSDLGIYIGLLFILGLIAAAYSSADSALTALTTSVSVDFLDIEKKEEAKQQVLRKRVHLAMSAVILLVILILHYTLDLSAIDQVIFIAGFTYGPLIGIFLFGLTTGWRVNGLAFPIIAVAAPLTTWYLSSNAKILFDGFSFGALHIALNAALTYGMLVLAAKIFTEKPKEESPLDASMPANV